MLLPDPSPQVISWVQIELERLTRGVPYFRGLSWHSGANVDELVRPYALILVETSEQLELESTEYEVTINVELHQSKCLEDPGISEPIEDRDILLERQRSFGAEVHTLIQKAWDEAFLKKNPKFKGTNWYLNRLGRGGYEEAQDQVDTSEFVSRTYFTVEMQWRV